MKHIEVVERLLGERTRRPDITFYRNGRIDITASVAERLSLRAGDVIDIARGKEEYYLYVRLRRSDGAVGRHEAQCYPSKSGTRNFRAYSKNNGRRRHRNGQSGKDHCPDSAVQFGQTI